MSLKTDDNLGNGCVYRAIHRETLAYILDTVAQQEIWPFRGLFVCLFVMLFQCPDIVYTMGAVIKYVR